MKILYCFIFKMYQYRGLIGREILKLSHKMYLILRTDSCDERRVYKREDISSPKGGTYMFNTSPKCSDFCLSNDVW